MNINFMHTPQRFRLMLLERKCIHERVTRFVSGKTELLIKKAMAKKRLCKRIIRCGCYIYAFMYIYSRSNRVQSGREK